MKTKPMWVYWCDWRADGTDPIADVSELKAAATRRRKNDRVAGLVCGPIVRVDVPLPAEKGERP